MNGTQSPLASIAHGPHNGLLPVVFLHSSAGNAHQFEHQQAHLARARRSIALDLPGHGRSPAAARLDIPSVADEVARSLDVLGVGRFVVVGHSWGGAVAVALAARLGDRVAGLLLLDPASDGRAIPEEVAKGLMRSLEEDYLPVVTEYYASLLEGAPPECAEQVLRDLALTPPASVKGSLESLLDFDPVTALRAVTAKKRTLVTRYNQVPSAYQVLVPELESRVIAGTGHWLQLDAPERVNAEIDEFLGEVDETREVA